MWLLFATVFNFMQSLVMYIDEHLTNTNKVPESSDPHTKVGGLILISTLMSFVGATVMSLIPHDPHLPTRAVVLSFTSALPMIVGSYIIYFYLLLRYPIQQVAPIFQLTALWLLLFEVVMGSRVSAGSLCGIGVLVYGTYILDTGSFRWQIPTKLLILSIPATFIWATSMLMVRLASYDGSAIAISIWQMLGGGIIGIILLTAVKKYREGFLYRIKHQGKTFLGLSLINESLAEGSYMFSNIAIAAAPVAAFVPASSGMQGIFIALMLFLFPLGQRTKISRTQWFSILLVSAGVFLIEYYR